MAKDLQHFPPVGDDARFDAIVSKGRSIRHRRQTVFGATTGSILAACIALVVVFGGNNGPAKPKQIFANEGKGGEAKSSTTTQVPDKMQVTVDVDGDTINVEVNDPRMPVPDDVAALGETSYRTQQCVLMTLLNGAGQSVAEGFDCQPFGPADTNSGSGTVSVQLNVANGLAIGCAAVEERLGPVTTEPQQMISRFTAGLPDVAPGEYKLTVEAVSGFGDGCPGNPEPGSTTGPEGPSGDGQFENSVGAEKPVTVSP